MKLLQFILSWIFLFRVDANGKSKGLTVNCYRPLGMQSGKINATEITASSFLSEWTLPSAARLHNTRNIYRNTIGAWCAGNANQPQYLQINLIHETNLTAVSTQGLDLVDVSSGYWVTNYSLNYSCDGRTWKEYKEGKKRKVFNANSDPATVVTNLLKAPLQARYVRVRPVDWNEYGQICLRVELYGCPTSRSRTACDDKRRKTLRTISQAPRPTVVDKRRTTDYTSYRPKKTSKDTKNAHDQNNSNCSNVLGMESGKIMDWQISASSSMSSWMRASAARLHNDMNVSRQTFGGWCSQRTNLNQYLQVDLRSNTRVTAISTQGMEHPSGNWVTRYALSFSCEGSLWQQYMVGGRPVVFPGNDDEEGVVTNKLLVPLYARYLRIRPLDWNVQGSICLRIELYGCNGSQECQRQTSFDVQGRRSGNEQSTSETSENSSKGSKSVQNEGNGSREVSATNAGFTTDVSVLHVIILALFATIALVR